MKRLITLLILLIVSVSLCSELPIQLPFSLPEIPTGTTGAATIDSGSPDIYVSVETPTSDIKSGRSVQVYFELRNKQLYDLTNVNLDVYDHPCFSDGDPNSGKFIKSDCGTSGTLRSNQSCSWSWLWYSDSEGSSGDRTCNIKFSVSYSAQNSIFQDIAILPEAEYNQRVADGTLSNVPIQSTSAKGPLQVYLTFSEPQPFIASQSGNDMTYDMRINYNNVGDGFFSGNPSVCFLNVPDNIENLNCEDYDSNFCLARSDGLRFVKGRSVPTLCNFTTSNVPTITIRSMDIEIGYTYALYGSFPIIVRGS